MIFFKILKAKIFFSIIKSALPIFLVPFYINIWGSDSYEIWVYYFNLCVVFSLIDFGFNQFSTTNLHLYKSSENLDFNKILGASNASYFIFFAVYILLILFFFHFGIHFITDFNLTLFFFLGSWYFFSLVNAYLIQMYRVFNEDHIGTYFAIIYNLILYLGTALLLYFFNSSPNDIAIFYLLIVNLSTISTFLFLKRKYKNIDLIHFDFKEIRNFLFRSSYYLLYKISTFLSINLPVILISILNQSNLLVFTLNRTLSNLQGQFINVAHSSLIQNITNNALNFELTKSFFIFSMNIMFAVSSLMSFIIFLLYEHILFLWLDYGENSNVQQILNYEVMKLLLIYTVVYNLWKSATVFVTSINKHESLSLIYLIYSIVFIIVIGASLHFSNIFIMLKLMIIMEVALLFYITKYVIQRVLEINISKLAEVLILNLLPISISIICITFFSELLAIIFVILAYVLYLKFTIKSNRHIYTTFFK